MKVKFWGHLAEIHEGYFDLEVENFAQLWSALDSIFPTFRKAFMEGGEYAFAVRRGDQIEFLSEDTLALPFDAEELHIVPKADGEVAEAAYAFAMWVGGLMSAGGFGYVAIYTAMAVAYIGATIAISAAIGAVVSMLSPKPQTGGNGRADERPSFAFSGALNVTEPGYPIPIVFGECLTGSVVISVGVTTEEIPLS